MLIYKVYSETNIIVYKETNICVLVSIGINQVKFK